MGRSERLTMVLDGDLPRALAWEAERRGVAVEALAQEILETAASVILVAWREARHLERIPGFKPTPQEISAVESVVLKAIGPRRRRRRRRPQRRAKA